MLQRVSSMRSGMRRSFGNMGYIMHIMASSAPLFLGLTLAFSAFSGLGDVMQSFLISKIIDGILAKGALNVIILYAIVIIVFQLAAKLQNRTLFSLNRVVTEQIGITMDRNILDCIGDIPLSKMDDPEFLNRMERARNLTKRTPHSIFMLLFGLISLLAGAIGYFVILSRINIVYVIVLTTCSVLIFISNNRYEENVVEYLFGTSPERRKMGYFSDLLTKRDSYEEVHSYGAVEFLRGQYVQNAQKQMRQSWMIFKQHSIFYTIAAIVAYAGCGLVYVLIIRRAIQGDISVGDTAMFLTACLGFQAVLTELIDGACSLPAQLGMLQNYRDFLEELKATTDDGSTVGSEASVDANTAVAHQSMNTSAPMSNFIRVNRLSFTYPHTDKAIFNDVSFDIRHGECIALVGANGAGKTTLVRLLAGFYTQYGGTITIDGKDARQLSQQERMRSMAILFQNYLKPSMSVSEATAYATDVDEAMVLRALEKSTYDISALSDGVNTQLTRMFSKTGIMPSGGQWQKLALARMFYKDVPMFVLDEPSASLDPRAEDEVFDMLSKMKGEHTIMFITHRLASVSIADRVIYIASDGRVIQGTHAGLMDSNREYGKMYMAQASKYKETRG